MARPVSQVFADDELNELQPLDFFRVHVAENKAFCYLWSSSAFGIRLEENHAATRYLHCNGTH
jgi:hypothetical protein